jgi:hypothetical protein
MTSSADAGSRSRIDRRRFRHCAFKLSLPQYALPKLSSPVHLAIAIRNFSKNSAKNLNQDIVVCRSEEC